MTKLTISDYRKILKHYNMKIPRNSQLLREKATSLLANKLCRCIKSVGKTMKNETQALKICRNSVLKRRRITVKRFQCQKRAKFLTSGRKTRRNKLLQKTGELIM